MMLIRYFHALLVTLLAVLFSVSCAKEPDVEAMEEMSQSASMYEEAASKRQIEDARGVKLEFELMGSDGNLVAQKDFLGKHVLLTFGFTQCEYVCPVIAANIAKTLKTSQASNALGIFISVDTERDDAAITHEYANGFHRNMIGLSGSYEQVNTAVNNFKASYSVIKTQRDYAVQHSTNIYHIGPEGNLIDIYAMNASSEVMSKAMN